jgi:hypothetical protein
MKGNTMNTALTSDEFKALQDYAQKHGRTWKKQLLADWFAARTTGPLQHLRNAYGPSWLVRFSFKNYRELPNDPYRHALGLD